MPTPEAPIALLGDAHLREGDPEVAAFVHFVETLPRDIRTLAILGDLFAVWIGTPDLQKPHHREVVDALIRLRARGCALVYVEGNHDFFLERLYARTLFDRFSADVLDLAMAGRRTHLEHGDLINRRDRQYLAWRAVSKSRPFFSAFSLLPARMRASIADGLEGRLARTNLPFRTGFPFDECEVQARKRIAEGSQILVFGHFHEELRLSFEEAGRNGAVFVLPAWRAGHRYLRIDPGAEPAFVSA